MKREWIVGRPFVLNYNGEGWVCEHLHQGRYGDTFRGSWHGDWADAMEEAWRIVRGCTCNHPAPDPPPRTPDKHAPMTWHRVPA